MHHDRQKSLEKVSTKPSPSCWELIQYMLPQTGGRLCSKNLDHSNFHISTEKETVWLSRPCMHEQYYIVVPQRHTGTDQNIPNEEESVGNAPHHLTQPHSRKE